MLLVIGFTCCFDVVVLSVVCGHFGCCFECLLDVCYCCWFVLWFDWLFCVDLDGVLDVVVVICYLGIVVCYLVCFVLFVVFLYTVIGCRYLRTLFVLC